MAIKVKKLLRKVRAFVDDDFRGQVKHADSMNSVLKKLKKRENQIKSELAEEKDRERRTKLEEKLAVVKAQRQKAVDILKDIQKAIGKI